MCSSRKSVGRLVEHYTIERLSLHPIHRDPDPILEIGDNILQHKIYLKGLSQEIDFKNVDKNLQN
jgi:hypothetical protein